MGLQLVPKSNFPFLKFRYLAIGVSGFFILCTIVLLFTKGLNYGIDFAGGTLIQIKTSQAQEVSTIRERLTSSGFQGLTIQEYGDANEFLIRAPDLGEESHTGTIAPKLAAALSVKGVTAEVRRVEYVGPQIGEELRQKGLIAILVSMAAILVYITFRFEFRYGVGAIAALAHDVILTVGVFSFLQKEITMPTLAALLTIIGYSLNDTIVVFDRIRENRSRHSTKSLIEILNLSLNEMLNRTLMTSITTLVALLALFFLGGEVIHDFAFSLIFGVIVGTYSSIFIAAPVLLMMEGYYQRIAKEGKSGSEPSSINS